MGNRPRRHLVLVAKPAASADGKVHGRCSSLKRSHIAADPAFLGLTFDPCYERLAWELLDAGLQDLERILTWGVATLVGKPWR